MYVSTKMHDTLKKPRELLMVSYAVRFPELAAKSKSLVGELDIDPQVCIVDKYIMKKLTKYVYRRWKVISSDYLA